MQRTDISHQRFGRLIATKALPLSLWLCRCDCGNKTKVPYRNLRSGNTKSCGCLHTEAIKRVKHGESRGSKTKEYRIWKGMRERCANPAHASYHRYGGRGIRVCKRWDKFQNFLADMGRCPDGMSIERKNNSRNYCKSNCKWAGIIEQCNNTSANRMVRFRGKKQSVSMWERELGLRSGELGRRLRSGLPMEEAIIRKRRYTPRYKRKS